VIFLIVVLCLLLDKTPIEPSNKSKLNVNLYVRGIKKAPEALFQMLFNIQNYLFKASPKLGRISFKTVFNKRGQAATTLPELV